jgi:transcriptional regulator with XRE-family HTH domain
VPGPRRDELAQPAGVSQSYYTRLEQGLSLNASAEVLDAIARALRLDETEHRTCTTSPPYSTNTVTRTTLAQDSIYDDGGAASGLLTLTALGSTAASGYTGTLTVGVETS